MAGNRSSLLGKNLWCALKKLDLSGVSTPDFVSSNLSRWGCYTTSRMVNTENTVDTAVRLLFHLVGRCKNADAPPRLPFSMGADEVIHLMDTVLFTPPTIGPPCTTGRRRKPLAVIVAIDFVKKMLQSLLERTTGRWWSSKAAWRLSLRIPMARCMMGVVMGGALYRSFVYFTC